ncbi:uncharacterized protein LOC100208971 isoform X5 [Hydra vulgaris]|uniref:Uncharacterized protein LOC100208971 isoform X5 n=1 Tax=Hydra vulgaris TaxID=6087 RepID=A0ABM4B6A5_HYDVU
MLIKFSVFATFILQVFNFPLATITESSSSFVTAPLCPIPLDIVIVIDSSGSVQKEWNDIIDHAQYFASTFNVSEQHTRIGIVDFSAVANVYKTVDNENTEEQVYNALESLRARPQNGETWLNLALQRTIELFGSATPQRENVRKIMVLYTDGKMTNKDEESLKNLIKSHRLVSVESYIVQVNNDSHESTLHEVASSKLHIFKLSGEPVESGKSFLNDAVCFNIDNDCTTPSPINPGCVKTTKPPCVTTTPSSQGGDCSTFTTPSTTTSTTPSTTTKSVDYNDCTTPTPAATGVNCGIATVISTTPQGLSYSTVTVQSKCLLEKMHATWLVESKVPTAVPVFIPDCNSDGKYNKIQHHEGTGYYWCVDPNTGDIIEGTTKDEGNSSDLPNCEIKDDTQSSNLTSCLKDRASKLKLSEKIPDLNIPECNPKDGLYESLQIGNEGRFKWCVDRFTGKLIEGTITDGAEKQPHCSDLSKCLIEREVARSKNNPYIPECTYDGLYNQVQNYAGNYWCVDIVKGTLIKGSMLQGKVPSCDQGKSVSENEFPANCLKELTSKKILVGTFVPQCDENGYYREIQVHGSTGNSWCVHKYEGTEIEGTRVGPGRNLKCPYASNPDCLLPQNSGLKEQPDLERSGCFELFPRFYYDWQQEKCVSFSYNGCGGNKNNFKSLEECQLNCNVTQGSPIHFQQEVDGTSETKIPSETPAFPISESEIIPTEKIPLGTPCSVVADFAKQVANSNKLLLGNYIPQCDQNGNYNPLQSHASTGIRWCVDVKTGVEIKGTRVNPGQNDPKCETSYSGNSVASTAMPSPDFVVIPVLTPPPTSKPTSVPTCLERASLNQQVTGAYVPQCEANGKYQVLQRHGSTGYKWCVDPNSGEEIPGTRFGPGIKDPVCDKVTVKQTHYAISPAGINVSIVTPTVATPTLNSSEKKSNCNFTIGTNLVKLGCYRDAQQVPRPLPVLLFDDEGSAEQHGDWAAYVNNVVCKCAVETEKRGWYTFGIQKYGACYSGPDEGRYKEDGQAKDKMCIGEDLQTCSTTNTQACVGITDGDQSTMANYIYMIKTDSHQSIRVIQYDKKKRSIPKKLIKRNKDKKHL